MGTITITVDTKIYDLLKKLAEESEKNEGEFFGKLVQKEDRKRHVKNLPYLGEKRFKCGRQGCFETQAELTETIEDGN